MTGIVTFILVLVLQTVTKRFLLKSKTLLVCSQEKYDTCITLCNIIRAVKREDYHITAILVNLMQAATVTPSTFSVGKMRLNTKGEHKK